jgi:quinol-cytochrome oxidoreductase complex cytochrome b subunit
MLKSDTMPTTNQPPEAPPPPSRLDGIFVRIDRLLARLDGMMNRWIPEEFNPLARSGAGANLSLLIAVASGILLLIWYKPSVHLAFSSLENLGENSLGGWVRTVHRYSSDIAMLFLFIHAGRTFFARKYSGSRWLPWVSGIILCALVWFIGWTGYWLIWDQPAQQIAISSMSFVDFLPVFGEPMSRLFVADRLVPSLLFFVVFFTHMLLPLGIAVGLAIHLMRVSRAKLLPNRIVSLSIIAGIAIASLFFPAPLDQEAAMNVKVDSFTVDAWYMSPLALGLRFQQTGLWFALFGGVALSILVPWIFGKRRNGITYQAVVTQSRCHSCNQCVDDCPFDAITLQPRTDGKAYDAQAYVNPALCVGCGVCAGSCDSEGIGLQWFDTLVEEKRIEADFENRLMEDESPWVAFICGDINGGLTYFDKTKWESILPDYQIHYIPTSSWLPPKLVEKLLKEGANGVLIIRDSRHEPTSRDGKEMIAERLLGYRSPAFRPQRATSSNWHVLDFTPGLETELTAEAQAFRQNPTPSVSKRAYRKPSMILAIIGLTSLVCATTILPSRLKVSNPGYLGPEFVFSFKALGDWSESAEIDPEQQKKLPVHMRGRSASKLSRSPVSIRITIDDVTEERTYSAKGISNDGPALDQWRERISVGTHNVSVQINTGEKTPPVIWEGNIQAEDKRIYVLTHEPLSGFKLEN